MTLTNKDKVQNIEGTVVCIQRPRGPWKQFWIKFSGKVWPDECQISTCNNPATDGAHVHIQGHKEEVFIIPMCTKCNNPNNKSSMKVDTNAVAVKVQQEDTDGPKKICFK